VRITNYTARGKDFSLYASLPQEAKLMSSKPECTVKEGKLLSFRVPRIKRNGVFEIEYVLSGIEKGDYDEPDIYFEGIDEQLIDGAEPYEEVFE